MGVHGLQAFLQKNASDEYCKKVDVKELAAEYKRETGKEPAVLVDGYNCLRSASLFGFNTEDRLLGGQMQEFIKAMKDFVAAFEVIYKICKTIVRSWRSVVQNRGVKMSSMLLPTGWPFDYMSPVYGHFTHFKCLTPYYILS
jgi:dissimilatory sulfite reductase (desulfoviridin) alpha/beta subunit